VRQTKPIPPHGQERVLAYTTGRRNCRWHQSYKQSQFLHTGGDRRGRRRSHYGSRFCGTKPIPRERQEGQVLYGKRVKMNWTSKWRRRNKANFPRRQEWGRASNAVNAAAAGTDCVKQTQFAADGQGRPSSRPEIVTMPLVRGASAPNKANSSARPGTDAGLQHREMEPLRGPLRQTKPISQRQQGRERTGKAAGRPLRRAILLNKANSHRESERTSPSRKKSYDGLDAQGGPAKQSQFQGPSRRARPIGLARCRGPRPGCRPPPAGRCPQVAVEKNARAGTIEGRLSCGPQRMTKS
jgi:hypothetical protein